MKSFKISTYSISSTRLTGKQKFPIRSLSPTSLRTCAASRGFLQICMALYLERITRLYTKQLLPVSLMQFWSAVIWL